MAASENSFAHFEHQVRQYRQETVLRTVAVVSAWLSHREFGRVVGPRLPNYVTPFALAAVAEAALVAGTILAKTPANLRDVVELCGVFSELDDPDLEQPADASLRGMMTRIAYQQFEFQISVHDEVARAVGLLLDYLPAQPQAPSSDDWTAVLGVDLPTYMRVVFGTFVAAVQNPAAVSRTLLAQDNVAPIFEPADVPTAHRVIDAWLALPVNAHRQWALRWRVPQREAWSPNSLQHRPVVSTGDELVVPVPQWVVGRMTATGLYYTGAAAFQRQFTDPLGGAFQEYVGAQLRLLDAARVLPEVVYGSPERRTVDWFVVTDQAVVLVEVKASRPVLATRAGADGADEDVLAKVGHARDQIDATVDLIESGHPAVSHIPTDRPLRGLVVTLEPFHLVDTILYADLLPAARIPTATASAHDVESACAILASRRDAGQRLLTALDGQPPTPPSLRNAVEGLPPVRNPILDGYWARWT